MNRKKTIIIIGALLIVAVAIAVLAIGSGSRSRHFLWELSGPYGQKAYIMGSIHLAHAGLYPLDSAITEAFAASSKLVVEINMEDMPIEEVNDYIQRYGYSTDSAPLLNRLAPPTRGVLERSGIYSPQLDPMSPWLAALVIQLEAMQKNGFESRFGLDTHFIGLAKRRQLDILELETIDEQMGLLVNMSEEEADLFLRAAILEMDDLPKIMKNFLATWREGDVPGFSAVFFDEYDKYPELLPLMDKIIFQRNRLMADRIQRQLAGSTETHFIIVGAGHLVGDPSVLSLLADQGYTLTQK